MREPDKPDTEKTRAELLEELGDLRGQLANLAAAEARFFNLFEYAGDSIFIVDPKTFRILDANNNACRRLAYPRNELLALTLDDIEVLTYDDFPVHVAWESSYSGTRVYECLYRRKDGFKMPVEVSSRIVTVEDQQVLQNFVRDITKRKAFEIRLREAHDRLYTLSRIDAELMRRLDVRYVFTLALDAAVRLSHADTGVIGLMEDGMIRLVHAIGEYTTHIDTVMVPDSGIVARVIQRHEAELVSDVHRDPDYAPRVLRTRAQMTLPLISHGRLLGVLNLETSDPDQFTPETFEFIKLLVTRVSLAFDNSHAYETLERLVEDLDAFAHTVAHDLKNPLNIILGYSSFLIEDYESLSLAEIHDTLGYILRGGQKMRTIIDELLLLASVRRQDEVAMQVLDMDRIVTGAIERLPMLIDRYNAVIQRPAHEQWPQMVGYAPWIEEVWANYISNAIKYGGTPPVIELGATRQDNGMIRCWVRDNGPGIPPEKHALLFNQFKRLEETRAQGHGLGLSIVQRIMQKLGGQVGAESAPGQGSLFYFTLPSG